MKITVAGIGYVGLANAILLAQHHEVIAYDISTEKVSKVNARISPIIDADISYYLENKVLHLQATNNAKEAFSKQDIIIIATPTDYDTEKKYFNTSSVDKSIEMVTAYNKDALIVIKSTIPVGYVEEARIKYNTTNIIFSPEFLREGKALYDNLYPSRIIVGEKSERAKQFAELLKEGCEKKEVEILLTNPTEAEAIKLFANTYLALRISFFNELDTYAEIKNLDSKQIIQGVSLDPRIGDFYNNPSFGYGGYCLPKDTKQLLSNYEEVPQDLIQAIVSSNDTRKQFIADSILKKEPKVVGIYRLTMKKDSDNFRQSSIFGVIENLRHENVELCIYEPMSEESELLGIPVISKLSAFKEKVDVIVANRLDAELMDVKDKVYTRDLFARD